jgi:hypothetical protein
MAADLPRILSPNLGCPFILSREELQSEGFDLVVAAKAGFPAGPFSLEARPSFENEGKDFSFELSDPQELTEGTLPARFKSIEETRRLISTTLQVAILEEQARFIRYRAKPRSSPGDEIYRKAGGGLRSALYDLHLGEGEKDAGAVFHALCLRPPGEGLRFMHLTDLHVALRNDLYADNIKENVSLPDFQDPEKTRFNNFNENLRRFIAHANALADKGELDLVLLTGDLVDFLRHGFQEREYYGGNNFRVFRDLILGTGPERIRKNSKGGLKVPLFTGTGNHDWRFFPYDPGVSHKVFGLSKEVAQQLDLFWADEQEEISRKSESFYSQLLREGSPISNKTGWGKLINWGLRYLEKWQVRVLTPISVSALVGLGDKFPLFGNWIKRGVGPYDNFFWGAMALVGMPVILEGLIGYIKRIIRKRIFDLMAIEAGWPALKDYFLNVNPFFNYAFRAGGHYFLMLDTGHDCVRAQLLWDDGDKKLGPVSILDNTIGQSPDSMAFYDINEYYPYSQIGWIERMMELIGEETKKEHRARRIFIGVHAPPANLSWDEARKAQKEAGDQPGGILLPKGEYNIRYGTINHYLSHFYHLCLGRTEQTPGEESYPRVDMVLSGHAHWKLEFRLSWDERKKGPAVYYGDFTGPAAKFPKDFDSYRPFLFQTPACGPREDYSPSPPYFRLVEIDKGGEILSAAVMELGGKGGAKKADLPDF